MIKRFLNLEWKQYFRSSYWQKNLALNILLVFFALYFVAIFLILGFSLYFILKKMYPDNDPLMVANGFLFFWIIGDLVVRFFFQKLPVMTVKPLLHLPIKRSTVVNYVLGKSAFSFFNFLPLFAIIPFGIILITKDYNAIEVVTWIFALIFITLIINFLNFIIENLSSKTELSFLPIIALAGGLYALNYFEIISIADGIGSGITAITKNPLLLTVLVLILVILYSLNYKSLYQKLYLDASLKTKVQEVNASNLEWTKRFGDIAPFMQLDLRLIWRNKRTKSMVWMLLMGLFYGLFFYPQPIYRDKEILYVLVGIFSTGIFLINFGQFIPAWDSGYYKILMSQNIQYKDYLRSKFTLMSISVVALFILGIPYVYFGWKILLVHFAAAVYNIGVNTHVILYGGSFNRKKIELDQKAAFNFQGTGAVQWIIGIPLMIFPMILFGLLNWLVSFEVAVGVIMLMGIIGIVFHTKIMTFITEKYSETKYKMIDAFSQDT